MSSNQNNPAGCKCHLLTLSKLNASVEVAHDIHSLNTAKMAIASPGFLHLGYGRHTVASIERYVEAAESAHRARFLLPMRESGMSRADKLAEFPSVARRHLSEDALRIAHYFDWVRRIDRETSSFTLGGRMFPHPHLKFYQKVKIRFFPTYAGDWFEVRSYTSEEVLFICKLN